MAFEEDGEELPSDLDDLFADKGTSKDPLIDDSDGESKEVVASKPTGDEECRPRVLFVTPACRPKGHRRA